MLKCVLNSGQMFFLLGGLRGGGVRGRRGGGVWNPLLKIFKGKLFFGKYFLEGGGEFLKQRKSSLIE